MHMERTYRSNFSRLPSCDSCVLCYFGVAFMTHLATYQASLTDEQRAESDNKLYTVEISMTVVICANNYLDALKVASSNASDIIKDIGLGDITVFDEIKCEKDLPKWWDVDTLPYGGKGDKTIGEILKENV